MLLERISSSSWAFNSAILWASERLPFWKTKLHPDNPKIMNKTSVNLKNLFLILILLGFSFCPV
jgi:hypothetical protein